MRTKEEIVNNSRFATVVNIYKSGTLKIIRFNDEQKYSNLVFNIKKDVEIDKKYALSKDEKVYLNLQINRGNEIQEQLDETWLDNGFMPYSTYIRQMNRFIAIQDSIISNIIEYMNELKRYKSKQ